MPISTSRRSRRAGNIRASRPSRSSGRVPGRTIVNGGALVAGNAGAFSATSATTINSGGTLDLGGFAQTINAVSLAGGTLQNGTLAGAVNSTGGTINGIGGTTSLTATSGTTFANGTNTFTGRTIVNGGALVAGNAGAFSATSATTINSGGTLDLGGFAQTINAVSLAGGTLHGSSVGLRLCRSKPPDPGVHRHGRCQSRCLASGVG
jgi:fibronectin-binding autotransporter adhesin